MDEFQQTVKKLSNLKPFIAYLEETNDTEWLRENVRTKDNSKNCVMGHLVNWFYGKEYEGNINMAWDMFEEMWATTYMIYPVNDGAPPKWMNYQYNQTTPKARVLAYLKNLIAGKEKTTHQLMEEYEPQAKNA